MKNRAETSWLVQRRRNVWKVVSYCAVLALVLGACGGEPASTTIGSDGAASTTAGSGDTTSTPTGDSPFDAPVDIEAAKAEGKVFFYSSEREESLRALVSGFKEKYGIEAEYYYAPSTALLERIRAELSAGAVQADVLLTVDTLIPEVEPHLAAYSPAEASALDESFRLPKATTVRVYAGALIWNTDRVSEPPTGWEDLLRPELKGQIGLIDANQTVMGVEQLEVLEGEFGDDFITDLVAQEPLVDKTGIAIAQDVGAGVLAMGVTYDYAVFGLSDAPVAAIIPEPTFLGASQIGIFESSTRPEAAKLFVEFAISAEGQELINGANHSIAVHPDAKVTDAHSLTDLPTIFPSDVAELMARMSDVVARFNQLFGAK